MKSKSKINKAYSDTLSKLEEMKSKFICINCTHEKSEHKIKEGVVYCDHRDVDDVCQCPGFSRNDLFIHDLEAQANLLKWILDGEDASLQIDDCIMPETIIWEPSIDSVPVGGQARITVDMVDEPYRTILLESSNKLPVLLPDPQVERVSMAVFIVYPSSNADRFVLNFSENESGVKYAEEQLAIRLADLKNRYGGSNGG